MLEVGYSTSTKSEMHECEATHEGDWVIFRCPICGDYERRINCNTGEMKVRSSKPHISHTGHNFPQLYQ